MIYGYSRKSHKFRNFLLIFFLMIAVSAGSIFIYSTYTKIEVIDYSKSGEEAATRLYNDAISEENDVINSLEDITRCVVRDIKNKKQRRDSFRFRWNRKIRTGKWRNYIR